MENEEIKNIRDAVRITKQAPNFTDYKKLKMEGKNFVEQAENFQTKAEELRTTAEILANLTKDQIKTINKYLGKPSCMENILEFLRENKLIDKSR